MDAQQFLAEFGHIANAPGGVARLREMIRAFAVRGDLIQHFAPWRECTLGSLGDWAIGCGFPKQEQGQEGNDILFAKVSDMNLPGNEKFIANTVNTITKETSERLRIKIHPPGTVIFPKIGGAISTNKRRIVSRPTAIDNNCLGLIPKGEATTEWLFLVLSSIDFSQYQVGTSVPALSQGIIAEIQCFLPSEEEQSRIVAKVDELMALCDKLEAQQQQRRRLQNNLRQSTLQAVAAAANPQELHSAWNRLADNFGQLFHAPEDVDEFIAELKNMAVRGMLSLPSQILPPVDEIVAACDELRARYIANGLMRRQKVIAAAETDIIYPEHWSTTPFDKVAIVIGGVTKGRNLRGRTVVTCPYLAVANVQRGFFKLNTLKAIQIAAEELEKYLVQEDDLLITEGGDWDKVGRTAIWRGGVENCLHQNHVFKARVPSQLLLNEWVELVFNSGVGRDYFAGASKQTTNLASINMTQLRSFPMPIPPLDEQRAILVKLDALTMRSGAWRKQLEKKQQVASLLAGATVAAFTGISTENEKDEPVKIPQTELIAPLRLGQAPDIKAQAPLATILARHNGEISAKDLYQRFGGEIDAFYAQLKTEVNHGWILEPEVAEMREKFIDRASA